jgi:hypothetical protein
MPALLLLHAPVQLTTQHTPYCCCCLTAQYTPYCCCCLTVVHLVVSVLCTALTLHSGMMLCQCDSMTQAEQHDTSLGATNRQRPARWCVIVKHLACKH